MPITPIFCLCLGNFLGFLWRGKLKFLALAILISSSSFQILRAFSIISELKREGVYFIYHSYKAQKELADFLIENEIYEPINLSTLSNLEILTRGRVRPIDRSFIFFFREAVFLKDEFLKMLKVLKMSENRHVIIGWIKPWDFENFRRVGLWSGLILKKIASFPKEKEKPVFVLAYVEPAVCSAY